MKDRDQINTYLKALGTYGKVTTKERQPNVVLKLATKKGHTEYLLDIKRHFANMDAVTVANQLIEKIKILPELKPMIATPYIRQNQAEALIKKGVDYFDLVGNAHIDAGDALVHIEGKKPAVKPECYKGRMLQKTGLQVLYILLTQNEAVHWPYRRIALAANVVHGTVALVLKDMRAQGFVLGKGAHAKVARKKELISLWVHGYINGLRPKLVINRYRTQLKDIEQIMDMLKKYFTGRTRRFAITGTQAAYCLQRYYRDNRLAFFADAVGVDLARHLKLVPDMNGTITHLNLFTDALITDICKAFPLTHPLITYAELLNDGTDRERDAANMLYEKYLKDIENED